jgi:transposase InsO family protein
MILPCRRVGAARKSNQRSPKSQYFTDEDIPHLRKRWLEEISDITGPIPLKLPPLREVNHRIPLIDPTMPIKHRYSKCPDALRPQLMEKIDRYITAGWWEEKNVPQASPLLCIPKKDGRLRTVVDCRERNLNTVKDLTPFPDQDMIRNDVARAPYRTKLDMSDAYEQVRVEPDDVKNTAFSTIVGTFLSHVVQQGDCNAPATFQRLMTRIFRQYLGKFVYIYLDDIFIFSYSIEKHEEHLRAVFDNLRSQHLYLSAKKVDLYSESMDCLGHRIDRRGLHADADKMKSIRDWPKPRDYNDVQRFLGMINYLSQFMPDVSTFTSPLSSMSKMKVWRWTPLHEKSFETLKVMACRSPILRPIDYQRAQESNEHIFLICDASIAGIGSYYGQGKDWETCRPAGFLSKKFSSAQVAYRTYEQETLAILEGLLRWEDKLLGRKMVIITDHKTLEFFNTQRTMSLRQIRWYEYLSRFDYSIQYVEGLKNVVADALSRMYAGRNSEIPVDDWVNADVRLDPEGETLPIDRLLECRAMQLRPRKPAGAVLKDAVEPRVNESIELRGTSKRLTRSATRGLQPTDGKAKPHGSQPPLVLGSLSGVAASTGVESQVVTDIPNREERLERLSREEDMAWNSGSPSSPLRVHVEGEDFLEIVRKGYTKDVLFSKIVSNVQQHPRYALKDGLLYFTNAVGSSVVAIPGSLSKGRRVTEIVIDQAHQIVGHKAARKTRDYIARWYWWPSMVKDVEAFCKSCGTCQTTKTSTTKPKGLLHTLPVPTTPWSSIAMDFVGPFPEVHGYDYLLVVICRLTSLVHLIPTVTTAKATDIAWIYLKEIVRLHGLPTTIVSDRDPKFISKFWRELHRLMGVKLLMSTAYHPQTDGMSERAIRNVTQVLRGCVSNDQSDWVERLPMVEFAINSTINESTGFAPFELTYGNMPRIINHIEPTPFDGVQAFAEKALTNLAIAHDSIIASRSFQTHYANRHRTAEEPLKEGDLVYLSTKNLKLPKGRAHKLLPTYIGPYKITSSNPSTSNYALGLPEELRTRNIHPTFHVSLLKPHIPNDDARFPTRDVRVFYDFGQDADVEWEVDEILAHQWVGKALKFLVKWNLGDSTWEPLKHCNQLRALDEYLSLRGVKSPAQLPKHK